MGCIASTETEKQNKTVSGDLNRDRQVDASIIKILFLGSGGSGKTTFFKQLRSIHGQGFENNDRLAFRDHIYSQAIEQIKLMIDCIDELKNEDRDKFGHLELTPNGQAAAQFMGNVRNDMDVDESIANNIQILWKEPAIREVFEQRAQLKIDDSCAYFFDEIKRLGVKSYVPNDQDLLLVRHRTTGVTEQKLDVNGRRLHLFDVGGQTSERRKWIHCFEHVTAVLFVASLSCYNEVLFEDDSVNAMDDSLALFKEICNLRWFATTAMILFLNKKDLFAEKIKKNIH